MFSNSKMDISKDSDQCSYGIIKHDITGHIFRNQSVASSFNLMKQKQKPNQG